MAKSPKTDKDLPEEAQESQEAAQDAVEDAVVIAETDAETSPDEDSADTEVPVESDDADPAENDGPEQTEETEAEIDTPAQEPERKSGLGGVVALLIGGVLAGGIGFGAAQYAEGDWPFAAPTDEPDPIAAAIENQTTQLADVAKRVETNSQSIATLKGDTSVDELGGNLRADIVATQSRIEDLNSRLDGLDARLSDLEKMPGGSSAEAAQTAADAYERELAQMREMLDRELAALKAEQEDAQALEVNAAEAAQAAAARAAMSRVMAAMESGQPFDDALFDLTQATGADAPEALSSIANDGAPTLVALQSEFPEAARSALDDALRDMVANGDISRGEAFLRTQLGTRSLEPKEGDDPDAILSRAEFALKNGRIDDALAELETLPDAAKPAVSDWIDSAKTRQAALDAAANLSDTLNQ